MRLRRGDVRELASCEREKREDESLGREGKQKKVRESREEGQSLTVEKRLSSLSPLPTLAN